MSPLIHGTCNTAPLTKVLSLIQRPKSLKAARSSLSPVTVKPASTLHYYKTESCRCDAGIPLLYLSTLYYQVISFCTCAWEFIPLSFDIKPACVWPPNLILNCDVSPPSTLTLCLHLAINYQYNPKIRGSLYLCYKVQLLTSSVDRRSLTLKVRRFCRLSG